MKINKILNKSLLREFNYNLYYKYDALKIMGKFKILTVPITGTQFGNYPRFNIKIYENENRNQL